MSRLWGEPSTTQHSANTVVYVEVLLGSRDIPDKKRTLQDSAQSVRHDDNITCLSVRHEVVTTLIPQPVVGIEHSAHNYRILFRGVWCHLSFMCTRRRTAVHRGWWDLEGERDYGHRGFEHLSWRSCKNTCKFFGIQSDILMIKKYIHISSPWIRSTFSTRFILSLV